MEQSDQNQAPACGKYNEPDMGPHNCLSMHSSIDGCSDKVPAAGNRNGSSLNNAGENGNYWSSTPNESDTQNAYNLNFNSGNRNTNWNNRNNGRSVRAVAELDKKTCVGCDPFHITGEQLLADLYQAYIDARCNKRGRRYQLSYEFNLEDNLVALRDELFNRTYKPLPSTCFIIHDPKMREVFAAEFRDRIVHHLFYNYVFEMYMRTFIEDCYSCIPGRGTHYGINRLRHHIQSVSRGYSKPCYVMKLDIKGYFMHISRPRLLATARETLRKMANRKSNIPGVTWSQKLDFDFVDWMLETIIMSNPVDGCRRIGDIGEWDGLPTDKSLFCSPAECGLPIGNLSSQLFSNIYLNKFDQFMKREAGCRHYGRYVDDAFVVSDDREWLKALVPRIASYLEEELCLSLNFRKLRIYDVSYGVEFLGAYIRPHRLYIANGSLKRMRKKLRKLKPQTPRQLQSSVNSFLGVLSHFSSYRLRKVLFGNNSLLCANGSFTTDYLKYYPMGLRR